MRKSVVCFQHHCKRRVAENRLMKLQFNACLIPELLGIFSSPKPEKILLAKPILNCVFFMVGNLLRCC